MKQLTIINATIPITESAIARFESDNALNLPAYLRSFFLKYNGARLKEHIYTADNRNYIISVLPLLQNSNDTSVADILPAVRDADEGIGRDDLIPFAADPGGRPFYVSVGLPDEGTVYYDTVGIGTNEGLRKIADSFEFFIDSLKEGD